MAEGALESQERQSGLDFLMFPSRARFSRHASFCNSVASIESTHCAILCRISSAGGMLGALITCPLEVVKTRLQVRETDVIPFQMRVLTRLLLFVTGAWE